MMDEKLIGEVQQHAIIYNRQKSNAINGDKCITKELAWQDIARNLGSDVDTCKKRWKYLRERYVQQKKSGSPSYEHLSRPYLEKMNFLDAFIQSRKSYRANGIFGPNTAGFDGNESSKSNSSLRTNDEVLSQFYGVNGYPLVNTLLSVKSEDGGLNDLHHQVHSEIKAGKNMPSSASSSIASQESPANLHDESSTHLRKRRRNGGGGDQHENSVHMKIGHDSQLNHFSENDDDQNSINNDDVDDDDDENVSEHHQTSSVLDNSQNNNIFHPLYQQQESARLRRTNEISMPDELPNPADLLNPFYQHAIARQFRNSDQLLGELVTSELLKMSKDRKKMVQKKILEILFFDDD